jgi:uncharacterized protein (TIGR03435 family)
MPKRIALFLAAAALMPGQAPLPGWKEFSIGPPGTQRSQFSRFGIRSEGVPFKRALARAFGLPEHRILGPSWIESERYAIVAQVEDPNKFQPLFQQELANRFHMLSHREVKDVPVFVMKAADGGGIKAQSAGPGVTTVSGGGLRMQGATMASFAGELSDLILRPVFDETGIDGKFDINLSWKNGNLASMQAAAKDQLGLQMVDDHRALEFLVIDHIEKLQFSK